MESPHRAGDADVCEASLLLHLGRLGERSDVREDALLATDQENHRELEALGRVQRHQHHLILDLLTIWAVDQRIGIGDERNLFEELVVTSSQDGGSYGNGGWASGPEDTGHGPNGPRNVVYNCDISSTKAGLWMCWMNENWLIMYNRFTVGRGPAILAKAASFDHIIQGNVFIVMEPYPGAIYIGSEDCTGIELINNRFFGPVDQLVAGPLRPDIEWDNRILKSGNINRPHAPVRSIFDWQKERE